MGWEKLRSSGRNGTGNWNGFDIPLEKIFLAAESWKKVVGDHDKLWLCWNISDEWSLLQQRMVKAAGWTPVVGYDPNCRPSKLQTIEGAIFIDFAADLGLEVMWPHFPLEFSFLWAKKLAFWHADLVMTMDVMKNTTQVFEKLRDGEMAAVFSTAGLRNLFRTKRHRYWELIGCTTEAASRHQFETGCGWWRHFEDHPNTTPDEYAIRKNYYYDSGVGIAYWEKKYRRRIVRLSERIYSPGHCSEIGHPNYIKSAHKGAELDLNFQINDVARKFGLEQYLNNFSK